jgi:thiamine biosynthesis lipoprotein
VRKCWPYIVGAVGLAAIVGLMIAGGRMLARGPAYRTVHPVGIMGTQTHLTAVADANARGRIEPALRAGEAAMRAMEARVSRYIHASELSALNAARAGQEVDLSADTRRMLELSRQIGRDSRGAFDVTYLPLFKLWGAAGKAGKLPGEAAIAEAKANCGWDKFELTARGARKTLEAAQVDLNGIAQGWAADRAVEAMKAAGVRGGLVDAGGEIRCFGPAPSGGLWRVGIRNPFDPNSGGYFGILLMTDLAVSTSGDYFKFSEVGGRRLSHIVDPNSGWPVDFAPSVTVVAPTAALADAWSTALSVLGPDGLKHLPDGERIEAMVVVGDPNEYRIHQTPGFGKLLEAPLPEGAGMTQSKASPR